KLIAKDYGLKYSALIELLYFHPVKHTPIDPMHNLFFGTAKHCRLPLKIESGFSGFSADQWRNWTMSYCKRNIKVGKTYVSSYMSMLPSMLCALHIRKCLPADVAHNAAINAVRIIKLMPAG
uniref:Uncharacterized protein n=1 Tax=Amphimedon queenslandica TaxID=400682 RepID=A0A1X7VJE2_AMPQE